MLSALPCKVDCEYLTTFCVVERDEPSVGGRGEAGRVFPVTSPLPLSPLSSHVRSPGVSSRLSALCQSQLSTIENIDKLLQALSQAQS